MSPPRAAMDLWLRVRLSAYNDHLWAHQRVLLLREVLALRYGLNPAALFSPDAPMDSFYALRDAYAHVPDDPMGQLAEQMGHLAFGGLWALNIVNSDLDFDVAPLEILVPREAIPRLFERCDADRFPMLDFRPREHAQRGDGPGHPAAVELGGEAAWGSEQRDERDERYERDTVPDSSASPDGSVAGYDTSLLRVIDALRAMFVTAEQLGCYVPGDRATVPLVGNYLREHHPELTQRQQALVLRIVRPDWYPTGAPGKTGRAFGAVVEGVPEALWCCPSQA